MLVFSMGYIFWHVDGACKMNRSASPQHQIFFKKNVKILFYKNFISKEFLVFYDITRSV